MEPRYYGLKGKGTLHIIAAHCVEDARIFGWKIRAASEQSPIEVTSLTRKRETPSLNESDKYSEDKKSSNPFQIIFRHGLEAVHDFFHVLVNLNRRGFLFQ